MTDRAGPIVWLTGLPGSGKTTLANAIARELRARAIACCVLDGDELRDVLVPRPGYSPVERDQFYASLANLARLLAGQGLVVLVPATAHQRRFRERARLGPARLLEVFVDTPLEECRVRALRGVYVAGSSQVPGRDIPYEPPEQPDVVAHGGMDRDAVRHIADAVTSPGGYGSCDT